MRKSSLFRSLIAPVLLAGVLAAALWFLWSARSSDDAAVPDSAPVAPEVTPPAESVPSGSEPPSFSDDALVLLLDGWSHRILSGAELSVSFGDESRRPLGSFAVSFRSASEADLAELLVTDPDTVARLAARMVRYDPLLRCSADGCVSQRGEVPLSWLADISETPVFSASYLGWGVESGVLLAEVAVPSQAVFAAVGGPGLVPVEFAMQVASASAPSFEELSDDAPAAENGSLPARQRTTFALASAFGTLFELSPNWLTVEGPSAGRTADVPFAASDSALPSSLSDALSGNDFLAKGLAFSTPELALATPGWLTLLSSPTYGCYAALCVPTVVESAVSTLSSDSGMLCAAPGAETIVGVSSSAVRLAAVGSSQRWVYSAPAPFHQTAFWAGRDVADLDNHVPGGVGVFTGDPVLVSGELDVEVYGVWIYSGDPLAPHMVRLRDVNSTRTPAAVWPDAAAPFEPCR